MKDGSENNKPFPYGHRVAKWPETLVALENSPWKLLLIVNINTKKKSSNQLNYLDILYRKYKQQGLEVIAVHNGDAGEDGHVLQPLRLAFSIKSDIDYTIRKFFHMGGGDSQEGMLAINSDKQVVFSDSKIPDEDQLRIFVENKLLGNVNYSYYSPEPRKFFRMGQLISQLRVEVVETGLEQTLESQDLHNKM